MEVVQIEQYQQIIFDIFGAFQLLKFFGNVVIFYFIGLAFRFLIYSAFWIWPHIPACSDDNIHIYQLTAIIYYCLGWILQSEDLTAMAF